MEENQIIISEEYGNTEEITQDVVRDNIEVSDVENPVIGVTESQGIISDTNDMTIHNNLHDRDVDDAHPISAISNLRQELDALNTSKTPQTIYSDKDVYASYYTWVDGAKTTQFGHFVSIVDNTTNIQLCSGKNAFGITIDKAKAALVGNYDTSKYNEDTHALVATSGLVEVRYIGNVQVGDCVVPYIVLGEEDMDGAGMAKKSDSGYGYLVVALDNIGAAPCATIAFNIPADQIDDIGVNIQYLDERMDSAEIRINDAQITAAEALQKANETFKSHQTASDKVDNAVNYVDNKITDLGTELGALRQDVQNTRNDFMQAAQGNLAEAKEYANKVWADGEKIVDEKISNESEILRNYVDVSADETYSLITSIDMYSVGEYSQTYGLTLSQARAILKPGMVYIPTKHGDNNTHIEEYVFTNQDTIPPTETDVTYKFEDEFTFGKYYVWENIDVPSGDDSLNIDGYWWNEHGLGIAFDLLTVPMSPTIDLWYTFGEVSDELKAAGYESYTLYKWMSKKTNEAGEVIQEEGWKRVNILVGNVNNRLTSMIRHSADQIGLEVINARGSAATIGVRLTDMDSRVSMLAQWKDGADTKIAGIQSKADEASASVTQIAGRICGEYTIIEDSWSEADKDANTVYYSNKDEKYYYYNNGEWKNTKHPSEAGLRYDAASIVASINDAGTGVVINADRIGFEGKVFITSGDLEKDGTTIIDGSRIQTGKIMSANYKELDAIVVWGSDEKIVVPSLDKSSQGLLMTYNSDNQEYVVSGRGDCDDENIIIPSTYMGYPVVGIGPMAFMNDTKITSVVIPDGVTSISMNSFANCSNLIDLFIGNDVVSVLSYAFAGCTSLKHVIMPYLDASQDLDRDAFRETGAFTLYFIGDPSEFDGFNGDAQDFIPDLAPKCFYSEEEPIDTDYQYWHYGTAEGMEGSCLNLEDGSFDSKNFKVDSDGNVQVKGHIDAPSGSIGGWEITDHGIINTNDEDGLTSGFEVAHSDNPNALAVGSTKRDEWSDAPFRVTHKGKLFATDCDISGRVEADDGEIGGWYIGPTSLTTSGIGLYSSNSANNYRIQTDMKYEDIDVDYFDTWYEDNDYTVGTHSLPVYFTNMPRIGEEESARFVCRFTVICSDGADATINTIDGEEYNFLWEGERWDWEHHDQERCEINVTGSGRISISVTAYRAIPTSTLTGGFRVDTEGRTELLGGKIGPWHVNSEGIYIEDNLGEMIYLTSKGIARGNDLMSWREFFKINYRIQELNQRINSLELKMKSLT